MFAKDASRGRSIFTVAPTLRADVVKDVGEFRRKDLFDFRSFTATRVEFTRGGARRRRSTGRRTRTARTCGRTPPARRVDATQDRGRCWRKVSGLRAASFETAAHPSLKTPVLTVKAMFDKGKDTVTFGRAGTDVYASRQRRARLGQARRGAARRGHQGPRRPEVASRCMPEPCARRAGRRPRRPASWRRRCAVRQAPARRRLAPARRGRRVERGHSNDSARICWPRPPLPSVTPRRLGRRGPLARPRRAPVRAQPADAAHSRLGRQDRQRRLGGRRGGLGLHLRHRRCGRPRPIVDGVLTGRPDRRRLRRSHAGGPRRRHPAGVGGRAQGRRACGGSRAA